MAGNRNRVRSEVAKGVEALRSVDVVLNYAGTVPPSGNFPFGPFETDIDVKSVFVATAGTVATGGTITVFNGGTTNAIVAATTLANSTAFSSVEKTVKPQYARIKAGNIGVIALTGTYAGDNSVVKIGYDVPVYDPNAKYTTYGAYDDGI